MSKLVQIAAAALGIKGSLYDMSNHDRDSVKKYVRTHSNTELRDDVFLHNSNPLLEGMIGWAQLNTLVFRGSGKPYSALANGFEAAPDQRFDKPCIIRDNWPDKRVTTHMQTKAVLAWSKSFYVALEYAYGCISGTMAARLPGYLHFCWVETGIDVVQAVRSWERDNPGVLTDAIDEGKQHEVITPTVSRDRIVATWELHKAATGKYGHFVIANKTIHAGNFAAVMNTYTAISDKCDPGPARFHDYAALGGYIDRHILL